MPRPTSSVSRCVPPAPGSSPRPSRAADLGVPRRPAGRTRARARGRRRGWAAMTAIVGMGRRSMSLYSPGSAQEPAQRTCGRRPRPRWCIHLMSPPAASVRAPPEKTTACGFECSTSRTVPRSPASSSVSSALTGGVSSSTRVTGPAVSDDYGLIASAPLREVGLRFSMNADAPSVCSPDSKKSGLSSSTSLRPSNTARLGASASSNECLSSAGRWGRARAARWPTSRPRRRARRLRRPR